MGCKHTKLDNLQESLKNIKKRVRKKTPLLKLDQNQLYKSRLSVPCQNCMKIEEELKKCLQQGFISWPLNGNDTKQKMKEDEEQKNELLWMKYVQYKIKKQSYQKQNSSYQSEKTQKAQSYYQEIQSKSAVEIFKQQIKQTPEKSQADVMKTPAFKRVIQKQARNIQDVTFFLIASWSDEEVLIDSFEQTSFFNQIFFNQLHHYF